MRTRDRTTLGAGLTVLAVVGALLGVQYVGGGATPGTDGSALRTAGEVTHGSAVEDENRAKQGSAGAAENKPTGAFELTYVPEGFHVSDTDGPRKRGPANAGSSSASIRRMVHYNNLPAEGHEAAFVVTTVTGAPPTGLEKREARNPQAYWTTIHGHRALVQPPPRGDAG